MPTLSIWFMGFILVLMVGGSGVYIYGHGVHNMITPIGPLHTYYIARMYLHFKLGETLEAGNVLSQSLIHDWMSHALDLSQW